MELKESAVQVYIRCLAYNHKRYIRQCLDGFVMQQTNFRFVAVVHDDASTDGTADIIREYAEKYPEIIHPIYETENQYSKKDGSLTDIMDRHTWKGKYVAMCEGDDYWTDPLKLQKQYDLMEANPEMSLCFHAHYNLMADGTKVEKRPRMGIKEKYTVEDAILGGGAFFATNSMFYRTCYVKEEGRPEFWRKAPVGDVPCLLYHAYKGSIGFIDEFMSVYRTGAVGSWNVRNNTWKKRSRKHRLSMKMYDRFDEYTHYQFHKAIVQEKKKTIRLHYKKLLKLYCKKFLIQLHIIKY